MLEAQCSLPDIQEALASKETCPDDFVRYARLEWLAQEAYVVPIRVALPYTCEDPQALFEHFLRYRQQIEYRMLRHVRNLVRQARSVRQGTRPAPPEYAIAVAEMARTPQDAAPKTSDTAAPAKKKPNLLKPGGGLCIATFNTRTMGLARLKPQDMSIGDDHSITPLISFCKTHSIDVLSVQEHRWKIGPGEVARVERDGWVFHFNSAEDGLGGVAVLLSPRLVAKGAEPVVVNERLMATTFRVAKGTALVLSTYAPTAMHPEKQAQHRLLLQEHATRHTAGPVFIAGDFNATHVASEDADQLTETRAMAAAGLAQLMDALKCCSAGAIERFQPLPATFGSRCWSDPERAARRAVTLDHILVPRSLERHVVAVRVTVAPTYSDHRPLWFGSRSAAARSRRRRHGPRRRSISQLSNAAPR